MRTGFRCAVLLAVAIAVPALAPAAIAAPAKAGVCVRAVSIAPQRSASEGVEKLTFTVFSGGCPVAGEVGYVVTAGTAGGSDFRAQKGSLRWADREVANRAITVAIAQDSEVEAGIEDFTVRLVDPDPNLRIARSAGQGRILDDDGPALFFTIDSDDCPWPTPDGYCPCPPSTVELHPNEPNCVDPQLHLSAPQPSPVTVHWSTLNGTALAGLDYLPVNDDIVTVAAGATMTGLPVRLLQRPNGTPARSFYVRIHHPSTGTVVAGTAVITIGEP
jgi:hypothetical protein